MNESGVAVRLKDLHKTFGGLHALDGLDLAIEPGELVALLLPRKLMATCRLVRLNSEAMVNSPSTSATVRKAADTTADWMLGSTTRQITVPHPAPRLRAASARVRTSMADNPASSAR